MKRIILLIIIITVAVPLVTAQTHYIPRISFGAHGGMTMGEMSFSPSVRQKMTYGAAGGVSFRWAEERHVGIKAELNFAQRGWAENFEDSDLRYARHLSYIELPVMTHIFFGSRRVNFFFNLGPQIGYMIADNITSNFDYSNPSSVEGFPTNRQTLQMSMEVKNRFDYGITAGGGVEFYVNPYNSIYIEGRYYYGLGNIYPSSKKDYFAASRTTMVAVTVGYMFRLHGKLPQKVK